MPLLLQCKGGAEQDSAGARVPPPASSPCPIESGPCRATYKGGVVVLDISPRPLLPMRELDFKVTLHNLAGSSVYALDLSMPGMYMGPNMIEMRPGAAEPWVFTGKGVFARCPTGGTLWRARVMIREADKSEGEAGFEFEVGR